ncbi:MAG: TIGR00159 family protein, partial [Firmicutes bacterium]|nr:TIGR00159 family protein [Bacillota bacterium]
MQKFFENVFSGVGIADVIDILIVTFVVYQLLKLIKQTRAEQLLKGVLVLVVATVVTGMLNLHTINWILKGAVSLGAVAI